MKPQNRTSVYALVLAAGRSARFGGTKQLETLEGTSLVRRAMKAATAVCADRVILVTGHDWRTVAESGLNRTGFLIRNESHDSGIGTSIALGVRVLRHVADAVLIVLADQPLVDAAHLGNLIATWGNAPDEIVVSAYADTSGAPGLFPSGCFADLAELAADSGGKHLLKDPRFRVTFVRFEPAAVDIDTPADLARL